MEEGFERIETGIGYRWPQGAYWGTLPPLENQRDVGALLSYLFKRLKFIIYTTHVLDIFFMV